MVLPLEIKSFLEEEGIREEVEGGRHQASAGLANRTGPYRNKRRQTNDRGNLNALVGKNHSDGAMSLFGARINAHYVTPQSHGLHSVRPGRFHGHL